MARENKSWGVGMLFVKIYNPNEFNCSFSFSQIISVLSTYWIIICVVISVFVEGAESIETLLVGVMPA